MYPGHSVTRVRSNNKRQRCDCSKCKGKEVLLGKSALYEHRKKDRLQASQVETESISTSSEEGSSSEYSPDELIYAEEQVMSSEEHYTSEDDDDEEQVMYQKVQTLAAFLLTLVNRGVAKVHILDVAKVFGSFINEIVPGAKFPMTWHKLERIADLGHKYARGTVMIKCHCGLFNEDTNDRYGTIHACTFFLR